MKRERLLNLFAFIFNIAIVVLVTLPLITQFILKSEPMGTYLRYEILGALVVGLFSLISIPFNLIGLANGTKLPRGIVILNHIGTVAAVSMVVLGFARLIAAGFDYFGTFADPTMLMLGLLVPVLALLSFIFFDHSEKLGFGLFFVGWIVPLLYFGFYIINFVVNLIEIGGGFEYCGFSARGTAGYIFVIGVILVALLVALLLFVLNRLMNKAYFKEVEEAAPVVAKPIVINSNAEEPAKEEPELQKEEPEEELRKEEPEEELQKEEPEQEEVSEEEPAELEKEEPVKEKAPKKPAAEKKPVEKKPVEKKPAEKKPAEKKPAEKKPVVKEEAPKADATKVYHLTKRKEDGMWAITFVGGQKAVKLFKTKKEAEEYLETLTKNQGATALIRNSKGAKAGKFASSIKSDEGK